MELSDTVKQKALAGGLAILILGMGSYWVFGTGEVKPEKAKVTQAPEERILRSDSGAPVVKQPKKMRESHIAATTDRPPKPHRPVATRNDKDKRGKRRGPKEGRPRKKQPMPPQG